MEPFFFQISPANFANLIAISAGIGVCLLCFMQVSSDRHLPKEAARYFRVFFGCILVYILMHLVRQTLEGYPGHPARVVLHLVTFFEFLASGFMVYMISILILFIADPGKIKKAVSLVYLVLLALHVLTLVLSQFTDLFYSFDAGNVYRRSPAYLLSNLSHALMMAQDIYLLVFFRKKFAPRVAAAFWVYILVPLAAMVLQAAIPGVQFIIFATVGAAVYMFSVIIADQRKKIELQQAESSRLDAELNMANRIQSDMLPNIFPAFPERDEFDVFASMRPAKEVGGDFYDFFLIGGDKLGLVIADVSGKGVPAALFMMISKILVQNVALSGKSPAEALETVNDQICANNRADMFVTVWLGVLDLSTGLLTAANAGHEYPAVKNPGGEFAYYTDKHGFVLGGMPGRKYREYSLRLAPGAKLFLYTDGAVEANDASGAQFGADRLLDALRGSGDKSPESTVKEVGEKIDAFVGQSPRFDDVTMLCLTYRGKEKKE